MAPKLIRKQKILRPAKKVAAFLVLLVQLARIAAIIGVMHLIYEKLLVEHQPIQMFDEGMGDGLSPEMCCEGCNCSMGGPQPVQLSDGTTNEAYPENAKQEWLMLIVTTVEVLTALSITYFVVGPLSPTVSIKRWFGWLLRMRIFWMRSVWTGMAVAFLVVNVNYRRAQYRAVPDPKYHDSPLVHATLAVTVVEYACLGMLESVVTIFKLETLESRLHKHDKAIRGLWKRLYMLCYYLCLFAFALRNFSLSLYFGLMSVMTSLGDAGGGAGRELNFYSGQVQVLQIYLAIIRSKYYSLFMRNLLAGFFYEADDQFYQHDIALHRAATQRKEVGEREGEGEDCRHGDEGEWCVALGAEEVNGEARKTQV